MLLVSAALGGSPTEFDEEAPVEVEIGPARHPRRSTYDTLPPPGQVAQVPGPRLPSRADGGGRADGPVHPHRTHTGGAGGQDPGSGRRSGSSRLRAYRSSGPHHVPGGGDRPGGRDPAPRRGAAGPGAPLPRIPLRDPSRPGRGRVEGDDPAGEGPLRRDPRQSGRPGLPPARGPAFDAAPSPERRGRVADAGHIQPRPAVPLLAAGPGHPQRHPLRHRHAGLLAGGLRPLGRPRT